MTERSFIFTGFKNGFTKQLQRVQHKLTLPRHLVKELLAGWELKATEPGKPVVGEIFSVY